MKRNRWTALLLAGAVCASMLTGCMKFTPINAEEEAEESVDAYQGALTLILPKKDEYLSYLHQAAKASAEAKGCTLNAVDCNEDQDKEIEYVTAAVNEGAEVIIIALADNTRAQDVITAAGDIPVVFVNRTPADLSVLDETHVYVGSNEDESGAYQGEALVAYLQEQGKTNINYLMFNGNEGQDSTIKRTAGVLTALDDAGIEATAAAEPVDCEYDRTEAMNAMNLMLADGIDMDTIDVIISNNDAMACGVMEALDQAEIDYSDIAIVGVDGTNSGIQAVNEGKMLATVYQNATGQAAAAVQAAVNLAGGVAFTENISFDADEENASVIWVPFELITADNVADYE
ncbi:MAG: substrate-binding domain-containing protein [Eubacteriales bacterium]|nr:substrate-binding domain-containing protein [Eubacteriales bacterium]